MYVGVYRDQKMISVILALESQLVVGYLKWVLWTTLWSSWSLFTTKPAIQTLIPSLDVHGLKKVQLYVDESPEVRRTSWENFSWVSINIFATMFLLTKTRGISASLMNSQLPSNCWDPEQKEMWLCYSWLQSRIFLFPQQKPSSYCPWDNLSC